MYDLTSVWERHRSTILIALLCLIWGSTWVVIKVGLADLPALRSAGIRFSIAACVMMALAPLLSKREGGDPPPTWLWILTGTTQFGISYAVVYLASQHLTSGMTALLWSSFPLMMAVLAHWWLPDERLGGVQVIGLLLGFCGVAVLCGVDLEGNSLGHALFLLVSPLVVSLATIALKKHGSQVSSVLLNRNGMCLGAALLLLGSLLFEQDAAPTWSLRSVGSVVYLALIGTVCSFGLYFWLLRTERATRMSVVAYVTPLIAAATGALVLDEPLPPAMFQGGFLILLGVYLAGRKRHRAVGSARPS